MSVGPLTPTSAGAPRKAEGPGTNARARSTGQHDHKDRASGSGTCPKPVTGPGHRTLLVASLLAGALVLVCADTVARTAVAYTDLPLGMLTSLVGGPFFFWLLRRTRRTAGGWA